MGSAKEFLDCKAGKCCGTCIYFTPEWDGAELMTGDCHCPELKKLGCDSIQTSASLVCKHHKQEK